MGLSRFVYIGPMLTLPDVSFTEPDGEETCCPSCPNAPLRTGTFCAQCGTKLVQRPRTRERRASLLHIVHDVDPSADSPLVDRWYTCETHHRVVLPNKANPHHRSADGYDTIDVPDDAAREAALAWFAADTQPLQDWLRAKGLPPATLSYGVLYGAM